jgi:hypothetical protein
MTISQTATTSFKVELAQGLHNFGPTTPNTFKIALYTSSASLGSATTAYTATGEVANGSGYTTGGETLVVSTTPTSSGTTMLLSFSDVTWAGASFTARGALIYNSTNANRSVAVLDFATNQTGTGNNFIIRFPSSNVTSAIIRIS